MLSADFGHLERDTQMIDRSAAEWAHIDVMDGVFVPNISFGFPVLKAIRKATAKCLDVHLMIVEPERYVARFAEAGADVVTFHYEATYNPKGCIEMIRNAGAKVGVSIKPATSVEVLRDILPQIRLAGEDAGELTDAGALLLDPTGTLKPGAPLCPPEGDAGTGMTATNSVRVRTGNISAGTSVFAMIVLEKALSKVHTEIDIVTTPTGKPVAMVHCNNCTSDINAWAGLFKSFAELIGAKCSMPQALDTMFFEALKGDADCGGLVSCNYFSGEPITGMEEGRPLFMRLPDSAFTFQNFARTQLYSAMATLKIGMDILIEKEHADVDSLLGHGGFFKAKGVGQKLMAGALHTPVSVMETAGEGGPWGMALLASYLVNAEDGETLEDYLDKNIFAEAKSETAEPDETDMQGFEKFLERYKATLPVEKSAVETLK